MNYKNVNDYELIYKIRENDEESMNELLKKYEPLIVGIAKKYFDSYKTYGIEMADLIQEGRIAIVKSIGSFDEEKNTLFYTYVIVCIERHLISYCRSLDTLKNRALNGYVSDECICLLDDDTYQPELIFNNVIYDNLINEMKNSLNFSDSNIFELRYNGFSYKEIAKLLGLTYATVSRRLCKIRKTLQEIKDKF